MVLDEPSLRDIEDTFAKLGRVMRENNRKQAYLPRGARVLYNENGTAPGFIAFRADGKFIASMPGVPREMKPMLRERVLPWLREHFEVHEAVHTRVLHTVNIAESEIDHRIDDLFRTMANPKIAVLAHGRLCDVKIMAKAESEQRARELIAPVEGQILHRLNGHVYGVDDQTLSGAVHVLLQQSCRTVAVAESCTGGSIAAQLTSVPGSSKSFVGGIVAYGNRVKMDVLGVQEATLDRVGAVSEETAIEMAEGVRTRLHADVGVATTGVAGPSGGTPEKPVGLVWLAIAHAGERRAVRMDFPGDRAAIQERATVAALALLWRELQR
jgi:nicotinamide-nucleotide amidase